MNKITLKIKKIEVGFELVEVVLDNDDPMILNLFQELPIILKSKNEIIHLVNTRIYSIGYNLPIALLDII